MEKPAIKNISSVITFALTDIRILMIGREFFKSKLIDDYHMLVSDNPSFYYFIEDKLSTDRFYTPWDPNKLNAI